jgi:hypothetical protein
MTRWWEPTLKVAQLSGRQVPRCGLALAAQLEEAIAQRLAVTTPGPRGHRESGSTTTRGTLAAAGLHLILAHAFAGAHPANNPACDPQAQTAQIVAGYFASLADHPAGEEVPPADPPTQPESMK